MSDALSRAISKYSDFLEHCEKRFPEDLPVKAVQGFLATYAISVVAGSTMGVAVLGGVIAITATIIEAVTRPLIELVLGRQPIVLSIFQSIVPPLLALGIADLATPLISLSFKPNFFVATWTAWYALNYRAFSQNKAIATTL